MVVKAKRMGWNEQLTAEQQLDLDPSEYDDIDLEGSLEIVEGDIPNVGSIKVYLVGGQEADPDTIEDAEKAIAEE